MQPNSFKINFAESFKTLNENYGLNVREFPAFTFGNVDQCREIIKKAFLQTDKTITEFQFTPELEELADWLTDTKGKGLFLTGNVGRGKTNIIMYVIPLIFFHFQRKVVKTVIAEELANKFSELKSKKFIAVDEMGVEPIVNEFGSKYEPINKLFNIAETESKILFVSTNLDGAQVLERYGTRTLDRIKRLCRIIKFNGESLRK
jgi:DNA replication protein DnaC